MNHVKRPRRGISIIEVMIVIAVVAVLAGILIPNSQTEVPQQLRSTAQVVASDIAYCQSLAISNNSNYRIVFSVANNRYALNHSGDDSTLDTLPDGVFQTAVLESVRRTQITDLSSMGSNVSLYAVYEMTPTAVSVSTLEFGPLGETTRAEETVIWLECGQSTGRRFISISVNPVTGLTTVGNIRSANP